MQHSILDFDLDYFTFPPVIYPFWASWLFPESQPERVREAWNRKYHFWMTRGQLAKRLRELEVPKLTSRGTFEDHQDAIPVWQRWIDDGTLVPPFTIYHFDAHSDLYLDPAARSDRFFEDIERRVASGADITYLLDEANYLWWAIYKGWTDRIYWIIPEPQYCLDRDIDLDEPFFTHHPDKAEQKRWQGLAEEQWATGAIERILGRRAGAREAFREYRRLKGKAMDARYGRPIICRRFGREVEIQLTTLSRLTALENPRAVNLCRSPDYTPAKVQRFYERFFELFD